MHKNVCVEFLITKSPLCIYGNCFHESVFFDISVTYLCYRRRNHPFIVTSYVIEPFPGTQWLNHIGVNCVCCLCLPVVVKRKATPDLLSFFKLTCASSREIMTLSTGMWV